MGVVVDLDAGPSGLAPLVGAGAEGATGVASLPGLSELLSGRASFAEVIHRDHASRLHFIPTGRADADFCDFDLILDALLETYDFIILLAPGFPRSDIAKVMAFLASDDAGFVTGVNLPVDGGLSASNGQPAQ